MTAFFNAIKTAFPLEYDNYIDAQSLPRIHSTSAMRAIKLLDKEVIPAKIDGKIFENEPHLYYFYGRAAYPISKGKLPRGDYSHFTFCFLFESNFEDIKYTFPFDSGAFLQGLYEGAIDSHLELLDFALLNNVDCVNEVVYRIFGNHYNYVTGQVPERNTEIGVNTPFEVQGYWNLVNNKTAKTADARCKTIEMVSTSDMKLGNTLLAIVMPEILLDNNIVKSFLKKHPLVDVITYPCFFGDTDDSYYGVVREHVYEYLLKKDLIEKKR